MSVLGTRQLRAETLTGNSWFAVAGVVIVACLIYSLSSNPGVGFHDSAELALRASQPGATHSPGAPVHTLLGYVLGQFLPDPALATNWLSILGGSLAAGIVCLILLELGANRKIAFAGGLAFALSFHIWGNSVVTETYSLSIFLLGCSVLTALHWRVKAGTKALVGTGLFYGLALGAHFANIILLPAFIFLTLADNPNRVRDTVYFVALVGLALLGIILANVFLAANVAPFGQATPDSLAGILFYMSGAEHDPLEVSGASFYLSRIYEHLTIFSRHYFFVLIPVGLGGACFLARRDWAYAGFLALIFCLYMGYFTLFGAGDYFTMVVPAYFVFSVWVGVAVTWLIKRYPAGAMKYLAYTILPGAILLSLASQFPGRYADARSGRADSFAEQTFAVLPDNSVVIAGWREFTVLAYYQQIYARRPDLTLILPARTKRHYSHADIEDYRVYIDSAICDRPIVTNKLPADLLSDYDVVSIDESSNWHRVEMRPSAPSCDS
jgi:hypothetical protein